MRILIQFDTILIGSLAAMAGKKQQNQPIVNVAGSRVAIQVQGSQIMPFSCTHPTAQSQGVVVQPLTGV